jgi:hypothetical protein
VIPTANSFLKGTIPDSIFVGSMNIENQMNFFKECPTACNKNKYLWSQAERLHLNGKRVFAEFLLSATMADKLCDEGIKLPSFEKNFWYFFSLSTSRSLSLRFTAVSAFLHPFLPLA